MKKNVLNGLGINWVTMRLMRKLMGGKSSLISMTGPPVSMQNTFTLNILGIANKTIPAHTIFEMSHVYMVTALETYLGDSLRSLVSKNDQYLANTVKYLRGKNKLSSKPIDLALDGEVVKKTVTKYLSESTYHNVEKTLNIYNECLNFSCEYDLKEITEAVDIRHDLVHRNGQRKDGLFVKLDLSKIKSTLSCIEKFVQHLDRELMNYRPN